MGTVQVLGRTRLRGPQLVLELEFCTPDAPISDPDELAYRVAKWPTALPKLYAGQCCNGRVYVCVLNYCLGRVWNNMLFLKV